MTVRHFLTPWTEEQGQVTNPIIEALDTLTGVAVVGEYRYAPANPGNGQPSKPLCLVTLRADDFSQLPVEQIEGVLEATNEPAIIGRLAAAGLLLGENGRFDLPTRCIRVFQPNFEGFRFRVAGKRGTFSDDFTGSNGDPLGNRAGWTSSGDADAMQLNTAGNQVCPNATTPTTFICTDQGSADNYTQARLYQVDAAHQTDYLASRIVDASNFIGLRIAGTGGAGLRLTRVSSGTPTDLITTQGVLTQWIKVECEGNDGRFYTGGTDSTPTWSQVGSAADISGITTTETSQGFRAGGNSEPTNGWMDDFEAGTLAAGAITAEGALQAQAAATTGAAVRTAKAQGTLSAQPAAISASAFRAAQAAAAMQAQLAAIVGEASREAKAQGAPQAQASAVVGSATVGSGATDTGFVIAGAGANDASYGTTAWSNPGNITADDGAVASAGPAENGTTTNYLKSSSHGFSIPSGAAIDGIEVRVQARKIFAGAGTFDRVRIVKGGVIGSTEGAASESLTTALADYDFGGATDLWGETWTADDINASTFGVVAAFTQASGFAGFEVDAIWVKVYYTEGNPTATGTLKAGASVISAAAYRAAKAAAAMPAQQSVIDGAATRTAFAEGTPKAQDAVIEGEAIGGKVLAQGVLKAGDSSVSGLATRVFNAIGILQAGASRVIGEATIVVAGTATGVLKAGASVVDGAATRGAKAAGVLQSGLASITGLASRAAYALGAIKSAVARIVGRAKRRWHDPDVQPSTTWTDADSGSTTWTDAPKGSTDWNDA